MALTKIRNESVRAQVGDTKVEVVWTYTEEGYCIYLTMNVEYGAATHEEDHREDSEMLGIGRKGVR